MERLARGGARVRLRAEHDGVTNALRVAKLVVLFMGSARLLGALASR